MANPASQTAVGPMTIVAVEQYSPEEQRLVQDELAYQRFRVKQKLWHFGMAPEQVATFLDAYGWRELEQMGSQEFVARYIRPSGRELPVSEVERSVYAEKIDSC